MQFFSGAKDVQKTMLTFDPKFLSNNINNKLKGCTYVKFHVRPNKFTIPEIGSKTLTLMLIMGYEVR